MPERVACYLGQLEPLIGTRRTIDEITLPKVIRGEGLKPADPHFRRNSDGLLEVYGPFNTKVIRPWHRPAEVLWTALPGQVLMPKRRKATRGEIQLIETGSKLADDWKVKREDGVLTVEIVEKFEDGIFGLIRQLELHIWNSLVGRKESGLTIPYGDQQQMEEAIRILALITLWLTEKTETSSEKIEKARAGVRKIAQDMEGVRAEAKVNALAILTKIAYERNLNDLIKLIVEAEHELVKRREEDIQMASACAARAKRILDHTVRRIDSGIRDGYEELAKLQEHLSRPLQKGLTLKQLENIARQIFNAYAFLVRVATFKPHHARVHSKEMVKLRDSVARAAAFGARGLRNDLKGARSKLAKLITGGERR